VVLNRCAMCEGPEHGARRGHVFGSAAHAAWRAQGIEPGAKTRAAPKAEKGAGKVNQPRRAGR
jgi:hypothetical protein